MVTNTASVATAPRPAGEKPFTFSKEVRSPRQDNGVFCLTPGEPKPPRSFSGGPAQGNGERKQQNNKVTLLGRLGQDAVVRQTTNGRTVANFSLGVDESYKDQLGEWQKKVTWHRVQVWGGLAETVGKDLLQGVRVYVEGRLIYRHWVDRQSQERTSAEIVASAIRFLDAAPRRQATNTSEFTEQNHRIEAKLAVDGAATPPRPA
jgi:single-strand DNA-binding protein